MSAIIDGSFDHLSAQVSGEYGHCSYGARTRFHSGTGTGTGSDTDAETDTDTETETETDADEDADEDAGGRGIIISPPHAAS